MRFEMCAKCCGEHLCFGFHFALATRICLKGVEMALGCLASITKPAFVTAPYQQNHTDTH